MVDIASRVWNHKWKIDPIVRSLIDTDFYKLLMCQSVFRNKPETQVTFSLINRSKHIPLADLIDEGELREQAMMGHGNLRVAVIGDVSGRGAERRVTGPRQRPACRAAGEPNCAANWGDR